MSLVCIAIFLLLALGAAPVARRPWAGGVVYTGCFLTSVAGLVDALPVLTGSAQGWSVVLPFGLPWIGAHFALDSLSAFFLCLVYLGGAMASVYALGYGRHEQAPQRVVPFYPAFLAGMSLVVLAADAFTFLLSWEFMSLASWALVMAHHKVRENASAGYVYIVMASFGTFALLMAFGMLAGPEGAYSFSAMRAGIHAPWQEAVILIFVLLGAGSKAGLVPLHVWLPLAHPAAPSHVSALMSGVMTKVAIYGFIRLTFDLLGGTGWEAALAILLLGGASAILGVLQAILHTDIKKILASSTVENVGIIFIALGLALAFRCNGMDGAAAIAFSAALLHAFNHTLFKSLLFFGAGAVLSATGERELDRMGGLIHRLPVTAGAMLLGCAAISALPPFNGFVSEWMIFQAILQSPAVPQWGLKLAIPAAGCLLALAAALAAACFVRFYGVAFLGRPRTAAATDAREVDAFSRAAMLFAAVSCVLAGIGSGFVMEAIGPAVRAVIPDGVLPGVRDFGLTLVPVSAERSAYNGLAVFLFVAGASAVTAFVARRIAFGGVRRGPAWDCGFPDSSVRSQYGAGSFAQPIRRVLCGHLFRAREHVEMPDPADLSPARLSVRVHDVIWDGLYRPISAGVQIVAGRSNAMQFLTIRKYLGLVFVFLVFLLAVLALWF
jgi:hydrogenase-4 component B